MLLAAGQGRARRGQARHGEARRGYHNFEGRIKCQEENK